MESAKANSLFLNIEWKTSENLTTEVLKYMLTSEEYSVCQKIIYNMIFSNDKNLDTKDLKFNVATQNNLEKENRPDCVIENEHMVIAIENKFHATFTKGNQIYRYCKGLKTKYPDKEKYLVLLTLKPMKYYYENEINKQFEKQQKLADKNLQQIFEDQGIKYKTIFWEDLFKKFPSSDVIVRNLHFFITEKFSTRTVLAEEELKMIKSDSIPSLLTTLLNGVDAIKNELNPTRGVKSPSKSASGKDFHGYTIKETFGNVWFGYSVPIWLKTKTPYVLQIKRNWIEKFDKRKILEVGFKEDDDYEYILPIKIDENGDIVNAPASKICEVIIQLKKVLS